MRIRYWIAWAIALLLIAWVNGRISLPASPTVHAELGPRGTNALAFTHYDETVQNEMAATITRLKTQLAKVHPVSLKCFGDPLTDEQITELETQFGYPLPAQLKAFLKIHGAPKKGADDGLFNTGFYFYGPASIYDWSTESTNWIPAEGKMSSPLDDHGWAPGFVIFMSNDYEFLGVYLENGKVYELDPESGYAEQASSLNEWFNNISDRLENGNYQGDSEEVFELKHPDGTFLSTPGQTK